VAVMSVGCGGIGFRSWWRGWGGRYGLLAAGSSELSGMVLVCDSWDTTKIAMVGDFLGRWVESLVCFTGHRRTAPENPQTD
jgi:hypothetical protein